jgi:hypothetical protein
MPQMQIYTALIFTFGAINRTKYFFKLENSTAILEIRSPNLPIQAHSQHTPPPQTTRTKNVHEWRFELMSSRTRGRRATPTLSCSLETHSLVKYLKRIKIKKIRNTRKKKGDICQFWMRYTYQ